MESETYEYGPVVASFRCHLDDWTLLTVPVTERAIAISTGYPPAPHIVNIYSFDHAKQLSVVSEA
jgi:hypothetical protein